jgi:hypothetical protein
LLILPGVRSGQPGPAAGINDPKIDRRDRPMVKIATTINGLMADTLTDHLKCTENGRFLNGILII